MFIPMRIPGRPVSAGARTIGGSGEPALTSLYSNFCSSLKGERTTPMRALPSSTCTRGSQKRPSNNPYSTPIALTSAVIGNINGFIRAGTSSNASGSSASATSTMFIGTAMRYAARTSCPPLMSNQSDPTATFHLGTRGRTRSSRSSIVCPPGSRKVTESPAS